MTIVLDELMTALADETARELSQRARARGLSCVNERDHLQPACAAASRTLAPGWRPPALMSTSLRPRSEWWPRLGAIDVALTFPDELPVALELKCGGGRDALGPCAWDALKLAFLLQSDAVSAGYLLAAMPTSDWQAAIRGAELFETGAIETLALRDRFLDWWRQWERLGDPQPIEVPRRFRTRTVAAAPVELVGPVWELRIAEVILEGHEHIAWPRTRSDLPV